MVMRFKAHGLHVDFGVFPDLGIDKTVESECEYALQKTFDGEAPVFVHGGTEEFLSGPAGVIQGEACSHDNVPNQRSTPDRIVIAYDREVTKQRARCHASFIEISDVVPMLHQPEKPRRYRAIFVSDIHLGTRRAQSQAFLEFMKATESDYLYLVGDIIDSWSLSKSWYWEQSHNDVIQMILRKARKGTRVIFIPGNHDENFREFSNLRFGKVAVLEESVHITAKGRRYLVLHGDKFDGVVCFAPWLAKLGDQAYEVSMSLNGLINWFRRFLRLPYWSLSAYLKFKIKKAVEFVSRYEDAVVREAKHRRCVGVICGHIHTPDNRIIDGIHYLNDGDWVESCTALVEHADGRFEILSWHTKKLVKQDDNFVSETFDEVPITAFTY
jgi:UDP-2,3-diacylglucosamine pyrophosphatase LpxH